MQIACRISTDVFMQTSRNCRRCRLARKSRKLNKCRLISSLMMPSWRKEAPQMLEEEISTCCKRLKLSRNLADMAQTTDGETHQEYLHKLLVAELKNREQNRTVKLINSAGFYSIK